MKKCTHTYTRTTHVQITNTLKRAFTRTYPRTDTALDRLTDPGVEFKGQHRSKVSSHGDSERLLDGDALDATATKLQVTLHSHFLVLNIQLIVLSIRAKCFAA